MQIHFFSMQPSLGGDSLDRGPDFININDGVFSPGAAGVGESPSRVVASHGIPGISVLLHTLPEHPGPD